MNYLIIAAVAFLLNGVSVLLSKFLLSGNRSHPLSYVFYISAYSLIILLVLPYLFFIHTPIPGGQTIVLASLSTIFWTIGIYFLFTALKIGLADRVSPVIGTLTPVFLVIYYSVLGTISLNQTWGAIVIILGLLFLILPYLNHHKGDVSDNEKRREIYLEVLSGLFFAISYILLKEVYVHTDFLSGLVYSKMVLLPGILVVLAAPRLKKIVFSSKQDQIKLLSGVGAIFIFSQLTGSISQLLITFAISIANPALVNSLQGVQYAFLFILSFLLAKRFPKIFPENFSRSTVLQNIVGMVLIAFGLFILAFAGSPQKNSVLGVTYSPRYAERLGLDPKLTFVKMLDDLNPKTVRLPIYWDKIEGKPGNFDFSNSDYYVKVAQSRHIDLTLVAGYKVPRYPECFIPSWAKGLPADQFQNRLYGEIEATVLHYRSNSSVKIWQVENEPLFPFGRCPSADLNRLKAEVSLVHELDPGKPVMITESGEYGLWLTTAKTSDIVGTTLYRRTLAPYVPQFKSPLPPFFYQFKAMIVHLFFPGKKVFVSELQSEPWTNVPITQTSIKDQTAAFPVSDLRDNVRFSEDAGFDTIYLWGVEWWYYLQNQGHPEYVNSAIMIFNDVN